MGGDWTTKPEITFERNLPIFLRLSVTAGALFFLGWQIGEVFTPPDVHSTSNSASVIVVAFCVLLIFASAFVSDVRWTIRPNEIQIDRKRGIGPWRVELVTRDDITEITILREGTEFGPRVWLLLHRLSGPSIESPSVPDGAQAEEVRAEIAKRLLLIASIKQI